mgnify:CR=1 FL=1
MLSSCSFVSSFWINYFIMRSTLTTGPNFPDQLCAAWGSLLRSNGSGFIAFKANVERFYVRRRIFLPETVYRWSSFQIANHLLRRYKNNSSAGQGPLALEQWPESIRSMTPTYDPPQPAHDPWKDRQRSGAGSYADALIIEVSPREEM